MPYKGIWAWPVASGLVLAASASNQSAGPAFERLAAEALAGPVSAIVERIVDGDTIDVRARIWLGQTLTVRVRIDGVDTPEMRSSCAEERRLAIAARDYLSRRLLDKEVTLLGVVYDKFGGRVRAELIDAEGSIAEALLKAGLARRYHGEARAPWCIAG
jgi:endonuclease YncB( thermonuclease family)